MVPGSLFKKREFLNKPIAVRHIAPALLSRPGPKPVAALFFQAFEAPMTQKKFVFTDRLIKQLPSHDPSSASRSAEYSDATVTGLRAVVGTNGNKSFAFRYQGMQRGIVEDRVAFDGDALHEEWRGIVHGRRRRLLRNGGQRG